jgi:hypothetical protein
VTLFHFGWTPQFGLRRRHLRAGSRRFGRHALIGLNLARSFYADEEVDRAGQKGHRARNQQCALIVLMFWTYYSAQIFLFGAELTQDDRVPAERQAR